MNRREFLLGSAAAAAGVAGCASSDTGHGSQSGPRAAHILFGACRPMGAPSRRA